MLRFHISPVSQKLQESLQQKIDTKTKPLRALGKLESLAKKIGSIQNKLNPNLNKPTIVVFAGDHGIANEGVSPYPQEVTFQMVMNFLAGGAAINVFGRQNGIDIKVVDAGVNHDFPEASNLINAKIAKGTQSCLNQAAMTEDQCRDALAKGANIISELHQLGTNVVGLGEMGIGNTSSAALLMSAICQIPIEKCVGRGTGVDDAGLVKKKEILKQAISNNSVDGSPLSALSTFGGFEIAMMCGAYLKAAELRMIILVDGFIATSAVLVASQFNPNVLDYCVFTHVSNEVGHQRMLKYLNADPLLNLDMRLGEGTGAAIAYPIIQGAVNFLVEMASFESAGVSELGS